jgi:hypothetical protein
MRRPPRLLAVPLAALLALGPVGCAQHRRPEPVAAVPDKPPAGTVALVAPPAEASTHQRGRPPSPAGTVALVAPPAATGQFQRPGAMGAGQGAKEGAKAGGAIAFVPGLVLIMGAAELRGDPRATIAALFLGLAMLGAGVVVAPVSAAVGATVGAIAAPSAGDVERSAAALERAVVDADLPRALPARIVEAGAPRPVIPPGDPTGLAADTLLELGAVTVLLVSKDPTDWRPDLRLRISLPGRLLRASDGGELGTWSWEHEGSQATFFEWAKDDARLFRAELERAGRALAARVITDLF